MVVVLPNISPNEKQETSPEDKVVNGWWHLETNFNQKKSWGIVVGNGKIENMNSHKISSLDFQQAIFVEFQKAY